MNSKTKTTLCENDAARGDDSQEIQPSQIASNSQEIQPSVLNMQTPWRFQYKIIVDNLLC